VSCYLTKHEKLLGGLGSVTKEWKFSIFIKRLEHIILYPFYEASTEKLTVAADLRGVPVARIFIMYLQIKGKICLLRNFGA